MGVPWGGRGLQEGAPWGLSLLLGCLLRSIREEELIMRKKKRRRKERRKIKGRKRKEKIWNFFQT
jgi:hypothetical protein